MQVSSLVFKEGNFGPLLKGKLGVLSVQQVEALLVVYFKVGGKQAELAFFLSLTNFFKHLGEDPRDDPALLPRVASAHSEGLTRACLAISKDSAIVAVEEVAHNRRSHSFKYVFLLCILVEDMGEFEAVAFLAVVDYSLAQVFRLVDVELFVVLVTVDQFVGRVAQMRPDSGKSLDLSPLHFTSSHR